MPATTDPARPVPPPPGWYADPAGRWQWRWWDGAAWSPAVRTGERAGQDPLPAGPAGRAAVDEIADTRAPLPPRAALLALAGLGCGYVLGFVGAEVGLAISTTEKVWALLLSQAGLWAGMIGACVLASRRYGTGGFRRDFAVRPRAVDAAWGLLFAFADWVAAAAVSYLVVTFLGRGYHGSNGSVVTGYNTDVPALAAVIAFAVVGAPIIEELFFRGLVQRALEPLAGVAVAVLVQGLIFGGVHVAEGSGAGRLGLWLALSAVGVVHGLVYQRFKRITVSMWTHALFNAANVMLIYATVLAWH